MSDQRLQPSPGHVCGRVGCVGSGGGAVRRAPGTEHTPIQVKLVLLEHVSVELPLPV